MKIVIAQALVAAWLAKNAKELEVLPGDEAARTAVVADALGAAVPYFESHPERASFLITTDGQAFYDDEANQHIAAQHALSLKEPHLKIVLRVLRSDVQEVLDAPKGNATLKAESTGNDYGAMTTIQLRQLLEEKGISHTHNQSKAQLIQLLLDSVGKVAVEAPEVETPATETPAEGDIEHVVTQEDLDNNPDLAAKGVKVGEKIFINPADLVPAPPAAIDYEAMTVKQLTAEAEKLNIIVIKDWKKADYIKAITDTIAANAKS